LASSTAAPRHAARRPHPATASATGHPSTTVPISALAPTAPTAYDATYVAPASKYTVTVRALAQCWVMATNPATGSVVWTGTLAPGASQSIPVSGNLVVRLGAPTVADVSVNDRPVQFPPSFGAPFDLTFQAAL
jgi:hypothetical protein